MAAKKDKKKQGQVWRPATRLVHEGTLRSQFGETSEAVFLNSGYVYDNAEQAERRFKGDEEGFVYSRYSNPTVDMFEKRMCALEGAEAARGTASGMAAVNASLFSFLKAGDHVVSARALFGSCRYIVEDLLPRFGVQTTLIDGRDLSAWEAAMRPNTRAVFFETPTNPVLELVDIEAVSKIAHKRRRARRRRQCVCHAHAAAADTARRRHRGLFRDQAYRRPGALPRRRGARHQGLHRGQAAHLPQANRPVAQPVQRLGAAQGSRDAALAGGAPWRVGGGDRRFSRGAKRSRPRVLSRARRSSAKRARQAADGWAAVPWSLSR